MKKALVLLLGVCFVALLIGSVAARDIANPGLRPAVSWPENGKSDLVDPGLRGLYEAAAVDTYQIVWYDFESMNWQGWTKFDETAQVSYFHVDDFVGLGGGRWGHLVPLEGTKSMWCGTRPNGSDPYLCTWITPPGYGNSWDQQLVTDPFNFQGAITLSYKLYFDSEPGWDWTIAEYDAGGGNWKELLKVSGRGDTIANHYVALTKSRTKLRFHFTSDSNTNDEDGQYNSDGGCIVDSIRITDLGVFNNYENFESAAVGSNSSGIWKSDPTPAYGTYSGLKNNLIDKDPCGDNFGAQVVFFIGSPNPSSSYPGLYDTPFCAGIGGLDPPCQAEDIISPAIDMTKYSADRGHLNNLSIPAGDLPGLGGTIIRWTTYRDLPIANLVFYTWGARELNDGCPGTWKSDNTVYYGGEQDYIQNGIDISTQLGTDKKVQIQVGCVDMCQYWYLVNGNCAAHTPSPWIDNVRLYRYKTIGPQWAMRVYDFFQDNFPGNEESIESPIRADMSNDIGLDAQPIDPGDSLVTGVASLKGGGIATDPTFGGPAVYLHVKATYVGPAPIKPALVGASLAGSVVTGTILAPVTINFNYVSDDGVWTVIQFDTARSGGGPQIDRYMVDLNDELFTRGYQVEYYFTAKDVSGMESALPTYARSGPPYYEFLCLPTQNSDVLFVDDADGRGADTDWRQVFDAVLAPPNNVVDRYDVNAPTSGLGNGLGARAKRTQLSNQYHKIVWDSGNIPSFTINDGINEKSNDCKILIDWLNLSEHDCGLWVLGENVAKDLDGMASLDALALMGTWCGVDYIANSYFDETGGRTGGGTITPLITGEADAGIFVHSGVPDHFYAFGGCPVINGFDVIDKATENAKYAASYPVKAATNRYAAIASDKLNAGSYHARTMWFGFSMMYVRDDVLSAPKDAFEISKNVFDWMQNVTNINVTPAETPKSTKLAQNFPNPFNPSTSIKFDLKDKGMVTLKVYNVAGQLVRTLVNGVKDANTYTVTWDGKNDRGGAVASGIYFYKMDTKDFSQTKKMVMLR